MELLLFIIAALLATVVWKLSKIERRLAGMHRDWARVIEPRQDAVSAGPLDFVDQPHQVPTEKPRSILDQISMQTGLVAYSQLELARERTLQKLRESAPE